MAVFLLEKAFFLQRPNSSSTEFYFGLFAVDSQSFGLQIRLPDFPGAALRVANVVAVLLTLFIKIKSLHRC